VPKKLLFSIEEDGSVIYLHINDVLIIPFKDLEEWEEFAQQMLGMMTEMSGNIETGNY